MFERIRLGYQEILAQRAKKREKMTQYYSDLLEISGGPNREGADWADKGALGIVMFMNAVQYDTPEKARAKAEELRNQRLSALETS